MRFPTSALTVTGRRWGGREEKVYPPWSSFSAKPPRGLAAGCHPIGGPKPDRKALKLCAPGFHQVCPFIHGRVGKRTKTLGNPCPLRLPQTPIRICDTRKLPHVKYLATELAKTTQVRKDGSKSLSMGLRTLACRTTPDDAPQTRRCPKGSSSLAQHECPFHSTRLPRRSHRRSQARRPWDPRSDWRP